MHTLSFVGQIQIITALVEGASTHSVGRMYGHHHRTVGRLAERVGEACAALLNETIRGIYAKNIEADEIWSFVGCKQARVVAGDDSERGDQWGWFAIDAVTKLILSYHVAKRTNEAAVQFMLDLRSRVVGRPQISTDGFAGYAQAVRMAFGEGADYAIIVGSGQGEAANDVTPPLTSVKARRSRVVQGDPDMNRAGTSHVERLNLNVRTFTRRFTRKTNAFSKLIRNHKAAVALFVAHHNFCRIHLTLGVTPAMAAGITDHVWSVAELVKAALSVRATRIAS